MSDATGKGARHRSEDTSERSSSEVARYVALWLLIGGVLLLILHLTAPGLPNVARLGIAIVVGALAAGGLQEVTARRARERRATRPKG